MSDAMPINDCETEEKPKAVIGSTKWTYFTLRDRFAMAALTGLLSDLHRPGNVTEFAESAYMFADAMLTERDKK